MKKDSQRIAKVKPFIDKYNQEKINYPSQKDGWKKPEKLNLVIALNVLYANKKEKICPAYISKHNLNREKQVILSMFRKRQMALFCSKKPSKLLIGVTSNNEGGFYSLNCLHSFKTKNKLESPKVICENKDSCTIVMPSEDTKILEFKQYQNSNKAPFIIYSDLECLIEKIGGCKNYT